MAANTGITEISKLLPRNAISNKMHLLLINGNLYQLQALIHLFNRFESHITAVSNKKDAIYVLKKCEFDLIVIDNHVLNIKNKNVSQLIQNTIADKSLVIIKSKKLEKQTSQRDIGDLHIYE